MSLKSLYPPLKEEISTSPSSSPIALLAGSGQGKGGEEKISPFSLGISSLSRELPSETNRPRLCNAASRATTAIERGTNDDAAKSSLSLPPFFPSPSPLRRAR